MAPHLRGAGGVSAAYILPRSCAPANPTELAGARVWIILRGARGDVLFAHIYVKIVEQFEDGLNAGDFLLTTDLAQSYRCSTTYDSGAVNFTISGAASFSIGMNEIGENFYKALSAQARRAVVVKLQKPSMVTKSVDRWFTTQGNSFIKAEYIMAMAAECLSLDEVWAGNKPKLPPFANFVYHALSSTYGETVADTLLNDLSLLDPTIIPPSDSEEMDVIGDQVRRPVVDVNLTSIDPNRIYARKFVAHCQKSVDFVDVAEKTEHAEKKHQNMLRDLAMKLISMGRVPLQSSSIDLFMATKNTFFVFELKTNTLKNIMGQAAKGAFQLGCYKAALLDTGYSNRNGKMVLIMEAPDVPELASYVFDVLSTFDISTLFYDINKPWPDRLKGLDKIIMDVDGGTM